MMAHPMIGMTKSSSSQVRWTLNFMTVSCIFQNLPRACQKIFCPISRLSSGGEPISPTIGFPKSH